MSVRVVAFFRNVNQGQRGHPATSDLLAAFADAGCDDAVTFQSNGTVVFPDAAADRAVQTAHAVQDALAARAGVEREIFVMPLDQVAELVEAHAREPDAARRELTLHGGGILDLSDASVAREAARRRCRRVAAGPGWTIAINERDRESNATPTVERLTSGPATSRGLPTLIRLVDRFAT
jgi:uncharacterized protein (DUF1697 family)